MKTTTMYPPANYPNKGDGWANQPTTMRRFNDKSIDSIAAKARRKIPLTLDEASRLTGLSASTVSAIEQGAIRKLRSMLEGVTIE